VVDPVGRIIEALPLGADGVLDARLPRPSALTPYARMGDLPTGLLLAFALAMVMRSRRRSPPGAAGPVR
jgi:apolipoprotein N-acyltransferase